MPKAKVSARKSPSNTSKKKLTNKLSLNPLQLGLTILGMIVLGYILFTSFAATIPATSGMWKPTADAPLRLGWVLENVSSADNLQTVNLKGQPIAEADVYDIDGETTPKSVVDALHAKGKKVICYIDAGVWEPYRSDAGAFPGGAEFGKAYTGDPQFASADIIGSIDQGWGQARWMDIRRIDILKPIMMNRMQKWCKDKGFDSIEPDEITDWSNNPGFPLTYADQIAYNKAVASWAHSLGLSIGLKGDLEQAHDLVNDFDWTLNEECYLYSECTSISNSGPGADGKDWPGLQLFSQQNKAVWIAEYPEEYAATFKDNTTASLLTSAKFDAICKDSKVNRFNTAFYKLALPTNGGRTDCPPYAAATSSPLPTTTTTPTPTPTTTTTPTPTITTTPTPTTTTTPAPTVSPAPVIDKVVPVGPASTGLNLYYDWLKGRYGLTLNWSAATDNIGVTNYRVFRNNVEISKTPTLQFTDFTVNPDISYTYKVIAEDAAGNKSVGSTPTVTTIRCFWIFCGLQ